MAKKRRKGDPREKLAAQDARREPRDAGGAIAAAALVLGLVGSGLAVDSGADNSFDAPKRLVALAFVAAAALAAFGFSRWKRPLPPLAAGFSDAGAAAVLFLAALAGAALSAVLSPRREASLAAMPPLLLYAALLPLGASRVVEKRKALLLASFVAIVAVNAIVSILQAAGRYQPFPLLTRGSRDATGAYVGNPGYLAMALALSAVGCLGIVLFGRGAAARTAAGIGAAISLAGLLVNRNLTSLSALAAGAVVLFVARFKKRAAVPIGILLLISAGVVLLYRPMRERAAETVAAVRQGDWDRVVTYRLGAWAAALEMTRDRPWAGYGPGTYGAEFAAHRLRAEIATRRRMVNPLTTSSYGEAHSDYLQPFAEVGIPSALALLASAFFLFRGLLRAARRLAGDARRAEAICVTALLAAGAVAALTWFPFQRPISALPLLLLAGRGWRIAAKAPDSDSRRGVGAVSVLRLIRGLLIGAILAALVAPEFRGYRAERLLRLGTEALRQLVAHPGEVADPRGALSRIEQIALSAAPALPGDSRPWILAGSTRLVAGEPDRAILFYRHALELGERAEIDINLGRAYETQGDFAKSRAAYLRALWISPALAGALLPDVASEIQPEVRRRESLLAAGKLEAPPPLPE